MHLPRLSHKNFLVKKISKNNIVYINLQVVKKYQTQPQDLHRLLLSIIMCMSHGLNAQFIHKRFGHASHQHSIQMAKLGI